MGFKPGRTLQTLELVQPSTGDLITAAYGSVGTGIALKIKEYTTTCTTDSTVTTVTGAIPENSILIACSIRVTTAITEGSWITQIGVSGDAAFLVQAGGGPGGLADNTLEQEGDVFTFPWQPGNNSQGTRPAGSGGGNITLTHNAQPSAGAIRTVVYYWAITPPTS